MCLCLCILVSASRLKWSALLGQSWAFRKVDAALFVPCGSYQPKFTSCIRSSVVFVGVSVLSKRLGRLECAPPALYLSFISPGPGILSVCPSADVRVSVFLWQYEAPESFLCRRGHQMFSTICVSARPPVTEGLDSEQYLSFSRSAFTSVSTSAATHMAFPVWPWVSVLKHPPCHSLS